MSGPLAPVTTQTRRGDAGYRYQPLRAEKNEIRPLYLEPGYEDEPLRCNLRPASLRSWSKPKYHTVSYAWGDPSKRAWVEINSMDVSIPASSEGALRRLRQPKEQLCVWIDAICINQADAIERGRQISLMAQIYKSSKGNFVYLGEDDTFVKAALDSLHEVSKAMRASTRDFKDLDRLLYLSDTHFSSGVLPIKLNAEVLTRFYSISWFWRLWVLQEAVLAPENICVCGSSRFSLLEVLREKTCGFSNAARMFDFVNDGYGFHHKSKRAKSLYEVLYHTQDLRATDPRDRLFGILGLFPDLPKFGDADMIRSLMRPDYTLPVQVVLRNATRLAILETEDLKVLTSLTHRPDEDVALDSGYSSWTVRFDRPFNREYDVNPLPVFHNAARRLRKCRRSAAALLRQDVSGDLLSVLGVEIGRVSEIGDIFSLELWKDGSGIRLLSLLLDVIHIATRFSPGLAQTQLRHILTAETDAFYGKANPNPTDDSAASIYNYNSTTGSPELNPSFRESLYRASLNRSFFTTDNGRIGIGPQTIRPGDSVAVVHLARRLLVLRSVGDDYRLVGNAYVYGLMAGEIGDEQVAQGMEEKVFCLR